MKVLLLKTNQIQEVKDSYALNYLIPKGLAVVATERVEKELEQRIQKRQAQTQEKKTRRESIVKNLSGKIYTISAKATSEGHLYASIGNNQIKKLLKTKEPLEIISSESIKTIGKHEIDIRIGGYKAKIMLEVKPS